MPGPTNILFDEESRRITALIDCDFFSCISVKKQRSGMQNSRGFRHPSHRRPTLIQTVLIDKLQRAGEHALEAEGVKHPGPISEINRVADVDTILCAILSWRVTNTDILSRQTGEVIIECRSESEHHLDKLP